MNPPSTIFCAARAGSAAQKSVAFMIARKTRSNPLPGIDQGHLGSDEGIVEVRLAARDQSSARRAAAGT
jgi:hypothetical protein